MLFNVHKYLVGECRDDEARFFSMLPSDRGCKYNLKQSMLHSSIRKHIFSVKVIKHCHMLLREVQSLPLETYKISPGYGPFQKLALL